MQKCRLGKLLPALLLSVALLGPQNVTTALAQTITLKVWDQFAPGGDDPRAKALAENISRFEAKYPNVKVTVNAVPFQLIDTQLIQAAAAQDTPDVVRLYSMFFALHEKAGTVEPLDEYVKGWDKTQFVIPWDSVVFGGKTLFMPYDVRTTLFEYRDDLLKEAGVAVPKTWAELCTAAGTLTKGNLTGIEIGMTKADLGSNLAENFVPLVWAAGGEVLNDKGDPAFNSKAGVQAMQAIHDIMHKCKGMTKASLSYTYNNVHEALRAGTIAMGTLGSHRVATIRSQGGVGERFRSAPLPGFTADKPAPAYTVFWSLGMGRYSKNKDAAWKYIEFMSSSESELVRAKAGEVPMRKATFDDAWFKSPQSGDMLAWRDYMVAHGRAFKHPANWQPFMRALADTAQAVMLDQAKIEPALNELAQKYKSLAN